MACICGLHEECFKPEPLAVEDPDTELVVLGIAYTCCCGDENAPAEAKTEARGVGRPVADPDAVGDVLSTGRKRAKMLYPIYEGMICEWSGLRFAGGGPRPVIGCRGNLARDVHHGPDKNTLNNSPDNIHRICTSCHEHFHSLNDPTYGPRPRKADGSIDGSVAYLPLPEYELTPHDTQTLATEDDHALSEKYWARNMRKGS